jgi:hypothetical protein
MKRLARRSRFAAPPRRTLGSRVRRFLWRWLRAVVVLGAALGPGMPPPPPPAPAPTEQVVEDGEVRDEQ